MRKILFVTHNFPPLSGGIAVYSQEICRGLAAAGVEVRVLTPVGGKEAATDPYRVIRFYEPGILGKMRRAAICRSLVLELKRNRPDLIFLASLHPYGLFVRILADSAGVPYVVGTHGSDVWRLIRGASGRGFFAWQGRRTLRGAVRVFSVSRYIAGLALDLAPGIRDPIILPNGVDTTLFQPGESTRAYWTAKSGIELENRFVICTVAALSRSKNHATALQAVASLIRRKKNVAYLIAGKGPLEAELQALVRRLDLQSHVAFLGNVDHSSVASLLRSCDLFLLPSSKLQGEGYGIAFLEAGACGVPAIGGDTGGIPEVIEDGETGFLVNPEDPGEIAQRIELLIENEALRRTMSHKARARAEVQTWEAAARRYIQALEEIFR
jgi:phosphatidylinositol alpha-1,6-mannosyltransferase